MYSFKLQDVNSTLGHLIPPKIKGNNLCVISFASELDHCWQIDLFLQSFQLKDTEEGFTECLKWTSRPFRSRKGPKNKRWLETLLNCQRCLFSLVFSPRLFNLMWNDSNVSWLVRSVAMFWFTTSCVLRRYTTTRWRVRSPEWRHCLCHRCLKYWLLRMFLRFKSIKVCRVCVLFPLQDE